MENYRYFRSLTHFLALRPSSLPPPEGLLAHLQPLTTRNGSVDVLPILLDCALLYPIDTIRPLFIEALQANPSIDNILRDQVAPHLVEAMEQLSSNSSSIKISLSDPLSEELWAVGRVVSKLVPVLVEFIQEGKKEQMLMATCKLYGKLALPLSFPTEQSKDELTKMLTLKLRLLETIKTLFLSLSIRSIQVSLFPILDLTASIDNTNVNIALFNQPPLSDLYFFYHSQTTDYLDKNEGQQGLIRETLATLNPPNLLNGILLFQPPRSAHSPPIISEGSKGKGKAKANDEDGLDISVTSVLTILPHLDFQTVKERIAKDDLKGKPVDELVATLLDEISAREIAEVSEIKEVEEEEKLRERFDVSDMNPSQFRTKGKRTKEDLLQDVQSFMDPALKASIIAAAEAVSDEEEEEFTTEFQSDRKIYDDDLGSDEDFPTFSVAGDGESSNDEVDNDGEDERPKNSEVVLEETFLSNPQVFERDSKTRRSTERADLKRRTGLADEQIEGWKVMLERDPKRLQRMKDRYAVMPNTNRIPIPESQNTRDDGTGASQKTGRGRGGRGGSGGGRGRGDGRNARGRGDGGKRAHDRRTRGRDMKMARAGGVS